MPYPDAIARKADTQAPDSGPTAAHPARRRWLDAGVVALANLLLYGYALDGVLTLADQALTSGFAATWLAGPRDAIAQSVLLLALLWIPVVTFLSRIPRWLLLFLALSAVWLNLGGQPIALWFDPRATAELTFALGGLQLVFAVLALAGVRRRFGHWWIGRHDLRAERWRATRWVLQWLPQGLVVIVLGVLYGPLFYLTLVQVASDNYVYFTNEGVRVRDVEFTDSHTVIRLIGMMHIGEARRYEALMTDFAGAGTIVLEEGVSDAGNLLGRNGSIVSRPRNGVTWQPPVSYFVEGRRVANAADPQEPGTTTLLNADVDISELSPRVLELIRRIRDVVRRATSAGSIDWVLLLSELNAPLDAELFTDLVDRRNAEVLAHAKAALGHYERIVIPWGAMHMPGISRELRSWGFEQRAETDHLLLSWRAVVDALRGGGD